MPINEVTPAIFAKAIDVGTTSSKGRNIRREKEPKKVRGGRLNMK
jgi:hypothetical protein